MVIRIIGIDGLHDQVFFPFFRQGIGALFPGAVLAFDRGDCEGKFLPHHIDGVGQACHRAVSRHKIYVVYRGGVERMHGLIFCQRQGVGLPRGGIASLLGDEGGGDRGGLDREGDGGQHAPIQHEGQRILDRGIVEFYGNVTGRGRRSAGGPAGPRDEAPADLLAFYGGDPQGRKVQRGEDGIQVVFYGEGHARQIYAVEGQGRLISVRRIGRHCRHFPVGIHDVGPGTVIPFFFIRGDFRQGTGIRRFATNEGNAAPIREGDDAVAFIPGVDGVHHQRGLPAECGVIGFPHTGHIALGGYLRGDDVPPGGLSIGLRGNDSAVSHEYDGKGLGQGGIACIECHAATGGPAGRPDANIAVFLRDSGQGIGALLDRVILGQGREEVAVLIIEGAGIFDRLIHRLHGNAARQGEDGVVLPPAKVARLLRHCRCLHRQVLCRVGAGTYRGRADLIGDRIRNRRVDRAHDMVLTIQRIAFPGTGIMGLLREGGDIGSVVCQGLPCCIGEVCQLPAILTDIGDVMHRGIQRVQGHMLARHGGHGCITIHGEGRISGLRNGRIVQNMFQRGTGRIQGGIQLLPICIIDADTVQPVQRGLHVPCHCHGRFIRIVGQDRGPGGGQVAPAQIDQVQRGIPKEPIVIPGRRQIRGGTVDQTHVERDELPGVILIKTAVLHTGKESIDAALCIPFSDQGLIQFGLHGTIRRIGKDGHDVLPRQGLKHRAQFLTAGGKERNDLIFQGIRHGRVGKECGIHGGKRGIDIHAHVEGAVAVQPVKRSGKGGGQLIDARGIPTQFQPQGNGQDTAVIKHRAEAIGRDRTICGIGPCREERQCLKEGIQQGLHMQALGGIDRRAVHLDRDDLTDKKVQQAGHHRLLHRIDRYGREQCVHGDIGGHRAGGDLAQAIYPAHSVQQLCRCVLILQHGKHTPQANGTRHGALAMRLGQDTVYLAHAHRVLEGDHIARGKECRDLLCIGRLLDRGKELFRRDRTTRGNGLAEGKCLFFPYQVHDGRGIQQGQHVLPGKDLLHIGQCDKRRERLDTGCVTQCMDDRIGHQRGKRILLQQKGDRLLIQCGKDLRQCVLQERHQFLVREEREQEVQIQMRIQERRRDQALQHIGGQGLPQFDAQQRQHLQIVPRGGRLTQAIRQQGTQFFLTKRHACIQYRGEDIGIQLQGKRPRERIVGQMQELLFFPFLGGRGCRGGQHRKGADRRRGGHQDESQKKSKQPTDQRLLFLHSFSSHA